MANFFKVHVCNKYCQEFDKPSGPIPSLCLADLGAGTGTRSMTIAHTGTELLRSIGADPEAFKRIFKYLKKFECGRQIKKAVKDAMS